MPRFGTGHGGKTLVISAFGRLRKEDHEFKTRLDYKVSSKFA
jgi:hypothetical protein